MTNPNAEVDKKLDEEYAKQRKMAYEKEINPERIIIVLGILIFIGILFPILIPVIF